MKTLYIDGDMLAYRSAFSNEVETKWNDNVWTLHTDVNASLAYFDDFITSLCIKFETNVYQLVFSPKRNFRYDLFPDYKADRGNKRKPLALYEIIKQVRDRHPSLLEEGIEADDLIGIRCTADPENTIAVSGDKDFATLPITWYNFLRDELRTLTEEEANRNHLTQTLTGDAVDGYAGLKGVGPKTAVKLLDKHGWDWDGVVKIYESKDQTEDDALLNARLAYILRNKDYTNQKVTLWTPTKQNNQK